MARDWDKERKSAKNMSIAGCIYGILFLIVWCAIAPFFMKLFGFIGLAMMVYRLYVCIQLSKEEKKKALPQEVEPWDCPAIPQPPRQETSASGKFCPYCGFEFQEGFEFCPKCGRRKS